MDPNVAFKNFIVAAILLGTVAFAALMFQPGSAANMGQGGWSNQGSFGGSWGSNRNWRGGDDDWDDDD